MRCPAVLSVNRRKGAGSQQWQALVMPSAGGDEEFCSGNQIHGYLKDLASWGRTTHSSPLFQLGLWKETSLWGWGSFIQAGYEISNSLAVHLSNAKTVYQSIYNIWFTVFCISQHSSRFQVCSSFPLANCFSSWFVLFLPPTLFFSLALSLKNRKEKKIQQEFNSKQSTLLDYT